MPEASIQASILNRFADVFWPNDGRVAEVGNRAERRGRRKASRNSASHEGFRLFIDYCLFNNNKFLDSVNFPVNSR